jgi:ZIP family zinc transporter
MNNIVFAFLLTLFAGLATGIGSLIAFLAKSTNKKFLSVSLGFSAGVMIYVSMVEIFVKAKDSLILARGEKVGSWLTVIAFFVGMFLIALIDKVVPSGENPHEIKLLPSEQDEEERTKKGLLRTGVFTALAIAIHNLPEGIAAGVGFGSGDTSQALIIAGGIALQNIPEGMVIISPMLSAGVSAKKTFLCAMITGLVEVVGTMIGYFAVSVASAILPFALAFAGGTMLYVISDEMIPETHAHGSERGATYALLVGFCVMLATDVLLG